MKSNTNNSIESQINNNNTSTANTLENSDKPKLQKYKSSQRTLKINSSFNNNLEKQSSSKIMSPSQIYYN